MEGDKFKKQFDELFRLFNKLMEKNALNEIPGMNQSQLEQLKMFLKNYESMKDHISFEALNQMNEPMKEMIGIFIQQLRKELGEPEPEADTSYIEIEPNMTIQNIDAMLSKPGLSEQEINHLLDERAKLVTQKQFREDFPDSLLPHYPTT